MLSLVAGSPIPDDPNRLISFAVTTEATTKSLADAHQNLSSVCQSMLPEHGNSLPQNSDAPYKVSASSENVKRGGVVTGRSEASVAKINAENKIKVLVLVIFQRTGNIKIQKFREELIAHFVL
jgi:hypothetical protein